MDYRIRPANIDDLIPLLAIEQESFPSDQLTRRQMRYMLTEAKALCLVAVDPRNRAVGYSLGLTPRHPRPARIYSLAVSRESRGHQLGQKLLSELLKQLEKLDYQSCRLEVRESDHQVQALYQRLGFSLIEHLPGYYEDGADGVRMALSFGDKAS